MLEQVRHTCIVCWERLYNSVLGGLNCITMATEIILNSFSYILFVFEALLAVEVKIVAMDSKLPGF